MFKEGDNLVSDTNTSFGGYWKVIRVNKHTYTLRTYNSLAEAVVGELTGKFLDYKKDIVWVNAHMSLK